MEEDDGGSSGSLGVGLEEEPGVDGCPIGAFDHVALEGDVVLRWRAVAAGVGGRTSRYAAYFGEVEEGFLFDIEETGG